jgi:hypothetical protein
MQAYEAETNSASADSGSSCNLTHTTTFDAHRKENTMSRLGTRLVIASVSLVTLSLVQGCQGDSTSTDENAEGAESAASGSWLMDEKDPRVAKINECAHHSDNLKDIAKETAGIGALILHTAAGLGWNPVGWVVLAIGGLIEGAAAGTAIAASVQRCGALDIDLANHGDWSPYRIKRSCGPGRPVVGTRHEGDNPTNLDIACGAPLTSSPSYHTVENGYQEKRWGYALDCADGEYVAGISYGVTSLYGIKSILCAKVDQSKQRNNTCHYLGDNTPECPDGSYMKGMWVERAYRDRGKIGVFVDPTNADLAEYGDQVKGVSCCSY